MRKVIEGAVVVITGASSGIGRAAAMGFAKEGARVVLAARRKELLDRIVDAIDASGGEALAVQTDVTDEAAVLALADRALERFGRIDVWINNAAVTAFGKFDDVPTEAFRRIIETNLFGYVNGVRAVLPIFRAQKRGILINNASMVAKLSEPYVSAYVASKHAIRGLGQSLRQELRLDKLKDVHVCTLMPSTIDTPFFQHAANWTSRAARAMPPVYPAERVARAMLKLVESPRREMFVGNSGRQLNFLAYFSPAGVERALARMTDRSQLFREQKHAPTTGNLFHTMLEGTEVSGGWKPSGSRRVLRAVAIAGGTGAAFAAVQLLRSRRDH